MSDRLYEVRAMIVTPRGDSIYLPGQDSELLTFRDHANHPNERSALEIAERKTDTRGLKNRRRLGVYGMVAGFVLEPSMGVQLPRNFTTVRRDLDLIASTLDNPNLYDEIDRQMLNDLMRSLA